MSDTQGVIAGVAGRYAKALFELSLETGATEVVRKDAGSLKQALSESADLRRAIVDPSIPREAMVGVTAALTKQLQLQPLTSKFLGLMAQKRRLPHLKNALEGFETLVAAQRGEATAHVTSAAPLTDAQAEQLAAGLSDMAGGRKIHMRREVDPDLIGGLVVQMGSKMIDASIRSKLARLQKSMKEVGR